MPVGPVSAGANVEDATPVGVQVVPPSDEVSQLRARVPGSGGRALPANDSVTEVTEPAGGVGTTVILPVFTTLIVAVAMLLSAPALSLS